MSRFNQYGGSFSGPIRIPKLVDGRNKVFFMFAYEGVRDALPAPTTNTMPTPAERNGDFSALLNVGSIYQIYDPLTGVVQGGRVARSPFPNNTIPGNRISPIAKNYLQYYALPNQPARPMGRPTSSPTRTESGTAFTTPSAGWTSIFDRHKFFFGARNNLRVGSGGNAFGKSVYDNPTSGNYLQRLNWGLTFDDVYTISPTFLMNSRLNWTRFVEPQTNFSLGYDSTSLGLPAYLSANAPRKILPRVSFSTFTALGSDGGIERPLDIFQIFESFTKIQGKHTLKFGVDLRQYRESQLNAGYSNGTFVFSTNWTNGPLDNSPAAPIGQDLAAFLLGMPTSGQYDLNAFRQNKNNYYAAYLQDDFRDSSQPDSEPGRAAGRRNTHDGALQPHRQRIRQHDSQSRSPPKPSRPMLPTRSRKSRPAQFKVNGGPLFASSGNTGIYSTPKANFSPRIRVCLDPGHCREDGAPRRRGHLLFPVRHRRQQCPRLQPDHTARGDQ